jgi:hypothetical protein
MGKSAVACAAVVGVLALCAAALASVQMQTALPLWDLSPGELGLLTRARWVAARASVHGLFSDGAAPVPGRLVAVLLQARPCAPSFQLKRGFPACN